MITRRERVISAAKDIWDKLTFGPDMRLARQRRSVFLDTYGEEAWIKAPATMDQVRWVYALRVMEGVALVGVGCAAAAYVALR